MLDLRLVTANPKPADGMPPSTTPKPAGQSKQKVP
jgi:hypothetical protein